MSLRGAKLRGNLNNKAVTLVELLIAILLVSVIFLAIGSIYVASERFNFTTSDKGTIAMELEYAMSHINKYIMKGYGITDYPSLTLVGDTEVTIYHIDEEDPADITPPDYENEDARRLYGYKIDETTETLLFDSNGDGVYETNLLPTVKIKKSENGEILSSFSLEGNTLVIKLTGEHLKIRGGNSRGQRVTLYSSSYPRQDSF